MKEPKVPPKDFQWSSTPSDIKIFVEGPLWRDIDSFFRESLEVWSEKLRYGFDLDIETIRWIQGIIFAYEEILALPQAIIEDIEDENQKTNEKER